ncbi:hypothetical protein [Nonomuraea sp. NPDC048916]|uniref:hypothetical protein n=1 Tax=Nonomuraea sp. NPDC048916 TaxID=3154232 RepID=UPI00340DFE7D
MEIVRTNWNGGLAATRHLVELGHRRGEVPESRRVELATELIVRESTAPPG